MLQLTLGQDQMEAWGWRIPFLIAGPLGVVAIYFRMKIEESPAFQATLDAEEESVRHPETGEVLGAMGPVGIFRAYWRRIVLAMILVAAANTVGYALTSYMPTYLTSNKGYDEIHGTLLTIPVLVVMSLCIPLTGHLSDRIGAAPCCGSVPSAPWSCAIPRSWLIAVGTVPATLAGLALVAFPVTFYVANLASALPALFPTAHRYGAMGIAYNFAVAIFGGTTPFIIASLIQVTGNDMMPAYYLMATSAIAAVTIYFLPNPPSGICPGRCPAWTRTRRPANWWRPRMRTRCWTWTRCPSRIASRPRGRRTTGSRRSCRE